MATYNVMFIWICSTYFISGGKCSRTNFQVKRFEVCNDTQGLIKYVGNITKEADGYQYLNFDTMTPFPLDDTIGATCSIQSKVGSNFVEVFVIREKDACKAAGKYMGELWNDIKRGGRLPSSCPITAGKYRARHVKVDFRKMTLQTFPFGKLRLIIKLINNRNANMKLLCLFAEIDNIED